MTHSADAHGLTLTTDATTNLTAVVVRDVAGTVIAEHVLEVDEALAFAARMREIATARIERGEPGSIDTYAVLLEVLEARDDASGERP